MEAEECAAEFAPRFAFTHEENPTPDWSTEVLQRSETKRKNERERSAESWACIQVKSDSRKTLNARKNLRSKNS